MSERPTDLWLDRLRRAAAAVARPLAFMEICGTHTMAAFRCGLRALLPDSVRLISGPGCPVCVTAPGDIDLILQAAQKPDVVLCTYGDMLRVGGIDGDSLEQRRADGADVRIIYSTLDAVDLAEKSPQKQVVLAAVGFETTTPATAAAVLQAQRRGLKNFSILASHKRVMPALEALLAEGDVSVQGLMCPGHVSIILGAGVYRPLAQRYRMPCVVAGFEPLQMMQTLALLAEMNQQGQARVDNIYAPLVREQGNQAALRLTERVFEPCDAEWRGLGKIGQSGLRLAAEFEQYDAAARLGLSRREGGEPPGCRCGQVIKGKQTPDQCPLFATVCTPTRPIGPCMVSGEGTCAAWFKYGRATAAGEAS